MIEYTIGKSTFFLIGALAYLLGAEPLGAAFIVISIVIDSTGTILEAIERKKDA